MNAHMRHLLFDLMVETACGLLSNLVLELKKEVRYANVYQVEACWLPTEPQMY